MMKRVLLWCGILALMAFHIAAFAMPAVMAVVFLLACLFFMVRKKGSELLLMLVSLLFVFACVEAGVRIMADDIFYREHERWALKSHYLPNVDSELQVRFGDMVAMDPSLKDMLAEPHAMVFSTDSEGFRNAKDYAGEPYVILGDSFATTIGATQPDTLVSQLNARMPQQFYSRAFPGSPQAYEAAALRHLRMNDKARFIWFVFEGNDFQRPGEAIGAPRRPDFKQDMRDIFTPLRLPFLTTRVIRLLLKSAKAERDAKGESPVIVHNVLGKKVGFLKRYIEYAQAPALELNMLGTPEIMERTACVFFIPEKYRVYRPWIENAEPVSEPAAGLVTLQNYFGAHAIPVIDLTPALQRAASTALQDKQFVYWRDDTHWNAQGIASIVDQVEGCMKADRKQ